jgi:hypothetical protein
MGHLSNPRRFRLVVEFELEVTDPLTVAAADPFIVVQDGMSGELGVPATPPAWQVADRLVQRTMWPALEATGFNVHGSGGRLWEPDEDGKYTTIQLVGSVDLPGEANDAE